MCIHTGGLSMLEVATRPIKSILFPVVIHHIIFPARPPQNAMDSSENCEKIIETIKNSVRYRVFKRVDIPEKYDDAAITFQISTIEFFLKSKTPNISTQVISDKLLNGCACAQIVAPAQGISTEKFLYWAEGGGLITGTTVEEMNLELPFHQATTYGPFKDTVKGMY
jgi:hypothetical protein